MLSASQRLARFGWAGLAVLGVFLLLLAWALHSSPRQYTATSVVSITPREAEAPPAASMFTLLTKSYVAFASSDHTAAKISQATGVPMDDIQRGTNVTMEPNTTNVEVEATMSSPGDAALVAGAVGVRLVAFSSYDRTLTASMVVPPTPPSSPELEGVRTLVVRTLLLTAGALIALAVLLGLSRRSART